MLIFAACLAIFVYGMVASMLGTIVPGLAAQFNLSNVQIGYIALAQGIGLASVSLAVGALMDRRGKKTGLILGLSLILIGLVQLTHPFGLLSIMGAMFVVGMGGSMVIVGANALGSDVSDARRASVLNFLNVFVGLGGLATPFIAGNLLGANPVRVAYGACAITALTLVVIAATKIQFRAAPRRENEAVTSAVFRNFSLYILAAVIFLYTACEFGIWNWLPKFLITRGIASSTALNILSLGFALGLLCGRVGAAQVLRKISPFSMTVAASVVMTVTTYVMLHTSNPSLTAAAVFCAGLAMAPVFPTVLSIVGDIFTRGTSTAMGFVITCGFSGLVVSSPIIGWLSGPNPQGLGTGLLVLPIFSACILFLLLFSKTRLAKAKAASAPAEIAV